MPYHMSRARMTAETLARIAETPEDRMAASKEGSKDSGGKMLGYWYSTGTSDIIAMSWEPDMIGTTALESVIWGSGAFLEFKHTWLLSMEEMKDAMRRSNEWPTLANYKPPGMAHGMAKDR